MADNRLDPKNFSAALVTALTHVQASGDQAEAQMADLLEQTAYRDQAGEPLAYRRFLAAALWLEARPRWLLKSPRGEFLDPARAITSLKRQQREMDASLGIALSNVSSYGDVLAGTAR